MANESYNTVNEGTRRSVMVGQSKKSIDEHYRSMSQRWSREFDQDSFLATIGNVEEVIEALAIHGAEGWEEPSRLQSDNPRQSSRLSEGSSVPPVLWGHDRATLSLYDPIQNLGVMCDDFYNQVNAWATKATYFGEVSIPLIVRTIDASTSEAETARILREALEYVGPINRRYVRSFNVFGRSMVEPIMELRKLDQFITSILEEGDEISVDDSKQKKTETATTDPALALDLLTLGEPSRDPKSSALIQLGSTIYNANPDTAPPGTPQWKKDLSERKGHRVHLLHVGALELDILAKCLVDLYNVTVKAKQCFRFIRDKKQLAGRMKKEYEQWAGSCEYLEDTFMEMGKGKNKKAGEGRFDHKGGNDANEHRSRRRANALVSGLQCEPYTLNSDTARGYGPQEDADAGPSGFHQMQMAAQSSPPPPNKQQHLRRPSSIIDLETYGLDSQSDPGSVTRSPSHHTELSPSLFAAEETNIGDFGMDFSSSTDGDDSDDSDRTIRLSSSRQGDPARRRFGSPVPSINDDDDEMSDYDSEDSDRTIGPREGGSGRSEEGALAADGGQGQGGVAATAIEDNGAGASEVAGMDVTATATAEKTDGAATETVYHDNDAEEQGYAGAAEQPANQQPQPTKSLTDRAGRRMGIYGEEL